MKVKVEIKNPSATLKRIFDDQTMIYAHTRLHELCSPYVPKDSGMLDDNVAIDEKCVHYKSPYAHYQYKGEVYGPNIPLSDGGFYSPPNQKKTPTGRPLQYSKDVNPLATSEWDKAMKVSKGDQLAQEISDYLKSR